MKLFGHIEIIDQLNNLLSHRRIPHALIFAGPVGSGKALFAHQFAFSLMTEKPRVEQKIDSDHPVWQQMNNGLHPDFLCLSEQYSPVIEGRLEFRAEDIHKLIKFFQNHRASAPWRVVIIDSIANLSIRSANSILKIIEEPEANTLIIIIAHNLADILPTIRSRCQIIQFNQLNKNDIQQILQFNNNNPIDVKFFESVFKLKCSLRSMILLTQKSYHKLLNPIHNALELIHHKQPHFYINLWDDWHKDDVLTSAGQTYNLAFEIIMNYIANWIFDNKNSLRNMNYNIKKIIDYWFKAHQQWSDAKIYNLDKKVTLTIIVNNFTLLISP